MLYVCYAVACYVVRCYAVLRCFMLFYAFLCCFSAVFLCCFMLFYAVSCYVMRCYAVFMLFHAMLCVVMLFYAVFILLVCCLNFKIMHFDSAPKRTKQRTPRHCPVESAIK